jgi:hypothetical protein
MAAPRFIDGRNLNEEAYGYGTRVVAILEWATGVAKLLRVDERAICQRLEAMDLLALAKHYPDAKQFNRVVADALRPFTTAARRAEQTAREWSCAGLSVPRGNRPCWHCDGFHRPAATYRRRRH